MDSKTFGVAVVGLDGSTRAAELLRVRLHPADLRTVLREIDQRTNSTKTIERIVAETENRSRLLNSRIPEGELSRFLVDIKGQDLLEERTLRRMLALRASESEKDSLGGSDSGGNPRDSIRDDHSSCPQFQIAMMHEVQRKA